MSLPIYVSRREAHLLAVAAGLFLTDPNGLRGLVIRAVQTDKLSIADLEAMTAGADNAQKFAANGTSGVDATVELFNVIQRLLKATGEANEGDAQ